MEPLLKVLNVAVKEYAVGRQGLDGRFFIGTHKAGVTHDVADEDGGGRASFRQPGFAE